VISGKIDGLLYCLHTNHDPAREECDSDLELRSQSVVGCVPVCLLLRFLTIGDNLAWTLALGLGFVGFRSHLRVEKLCHSGMS
jgi:hypothetical protein